MMEYTLRRKGPVTVQAQLASQIQMKIMAGELSTRDKLPSVRELARRLGIHANTVSAVYNRLRREGWLAHEHGGGLYVRRGAPSTLDPGLSIQEMLRLALSRALLQGVSPSHVRASVEEWLAATPPRRIVVVDSNLETAEILAAEIRQRFAVPIAVAVAETIARHGVPADALTISWPHLLDRLRPAVPEEGLTLLTLRRSADDRRVIRALPEGAVALVVSHSRRVLQYAEHLLTSERGSDIIVKCYDLSQGEAWRTAAPAADIVFADVMAAPILRRVVPRRTHEFRLVAEHALALMGGRLALAPPRLSLLTPSIDSTSARSA